MDNPSLTLQDELRRVKRRRIEIRGTKAALDLEDFNLDDRQSTLENLLRARNNPTPGSSVGNHDTRPDSDVREWVQTTTPSQKDSKPLCSTIQNEQIEIKKERTKNQQSYAPAEPIIIDIDDEEELTIPNSGPQTGCSQPEDTAEDAQQLRAWKNILKISPDETKTKTEPETGATAKPTKIIILKYKRRVPQQDQASRCVPLAASTTWMKESPRSVSQHPTPTLELDTQEPSGRTYKAPSTKPHRPFANIHRGSPSQQTPHSASPTRCNPTTESLNANFTGTDTDTPPCICLGRNRNCRTCRGTPAVIAEGRALQSLSHPRRHYASASTSHSRSLSPRTIGQRATSRPASYRIAEYEEMGDDERRELEMRFCRRIVTKVAELVDQRERDNADSSVHTQNEQWTWIDRLGDIQRVRDVFVTDLKALVKRKAVAREDDFGVWDGRILVARCHDSDEFTTEVDASVQRLTERHPLGCCCSSVDGDNAGIEGIRECWTSNFKSWLTVQIIRCHDCIDTCDSALNLEERRDVVDDWEIG